VLRFPPDIVEMYPVIPTLARLQLPLKEILLNS